MKALVRISSLLILMLLFAACSEQPTTDNDAGQSPADQTSNGGIIEGEAMIETIDVLIMESFPVQVRAVVSGNLSDGCTTIGETNIVYADNQFEISISTTRPADEACTQALVPFEQIIALDVLGLAAGDYNVTGGNVTAAFNLAVDNVIPDLEETEEPGDVDSVPALTGKIQGRLWHDICGTRDVGGGEPPLIAGDCIFDEIDGYTADGILTPDEPGIEGVEVQLLEGGCEGSVVGTIFTNADGSFAFDNLTAGTYCVRIDPLANPNSAILIPGGFTTIGEGAVEVDLAEGQDIPALNFGWDYQFLPLPSDIVGPEETPGSTETPEANEVDCTNSIVFVSETIEDDTLVAAGSNFTKSWTLENSGTCTWTNEYKLVFESGDKMKGTDVNLSGNVKPGETVRLEVDLVAPEIGGTYRGDWLIESDKGERFGLGSDADKVFWVQIKVEGSVANLDLGASDWSDPFNTGDNWFLVNTDAVRFSIEDGQLRLRAKIAGANEQWGLANRAPMDDYYLEGVFKTGPACSGLDRYGMLVRAPNPNAGYVFNISCNGQFRVYEWNGSNYNELKGWTSSTAIKEGPNATNRIGVWAKGDTLRLYINEILVTELNVDIYDAGQFGLLVGSTNTTNFDVFVDQISYWRLDN